MQRKKANLNIWAEQADRIKKLPEFSSVGLSGLARILVDEALAARNNEPVTKTGIVAALDLLNTQDILYVVIEGLKILQDKQETESLSLNIHETAMIQWALDFIGKKSGINPGRLEELCSGQTLPSEDEIESLTKTMATDYNVVKQALGLRNGEILQSDS